MPWVHGEGEPRAEPNCIKILLSLLGFVARDHQAASAPWPSKHPTSCTPQTTLTNRVPLSHPSCSAANSRPQSHPCPMAPSPHHPQALTSAQPTLLATDAPIPNLCDSKPAQRQFQEGNKQQTPPASSKCKNKCAERKDLLCLLLLRGLHGGKNPSSASHGRG